MVNFIISLSERIDNLEQKITNIDDDDFSVQFLNIAIKVSFSYSKEEVITYINYIRDYLIQEKLDDVLTHIYHIITSINPSSYKELLFLSNKLQDDYVSARKIYLNKKDGNQLGEIGILDSDFDFIRFNNVKELLNYGLLHEKRASFYDANPVSFIHKIKLSELGEKILDYIK